MKKHPLANCEECPLAVGGRFLESSGPEKATIAIVGDAPSIPDTRSGRNFAGDGGKLLDMILDHHHLDKDEMFLTHATLCRPADGQAPPKSAMLACQDRLTAELEAHGVKKVVAFGNTAAMALLGKDKVTQLRVGPPKKAKYNPEVAVIPTIHPAACLRMADQFPNLVTDVGKLLYNVQQFTEPRYAVSDGEHHAIELLDAIDDAFGSDSPIVVDIEVDIDKETSFGHPDQYGMLCVGIAFAKGRAIVLSEPDMGKSAVRVRLGHFLRTHRITAQNGKFDLAGLTPVVGRQKLDFDTMLASYVFDERSGIHGLKYQGQEYLGAPDWEAEIKQYVDKKTGYGAIPRPLLYKYNAYDVVTTFDLREMYEEKFKAEPQLREMHDFLVRASDALMTIEMNGFTVDMKHLRKLDAYYTEVINENRAKIDKLMRVDYDKAGGLNPNSPMQVKKALADWRINVPNTAEDTLKLLQEAFVKRGEEDKPQAQFVDLILKNRTEAKAHGTYVKGIENRLHHGKVYSTYLLHGTTTGRLASRNPNMQNIPRDKMLRGLFCVEHEDNILIQTDYSQAELRVLSYLAQDQYFRNIFNDPSRDLFDELTPVLYGDVSKDQMSAAQWKELRIRVKAYVYGLSYGREAQSIAMEYKIPVKQAVQDMKKFFEVIPEIVEFREKTRQAVLDGEDLVTPRGRRRRFGLITKQNKASVMNEALAFLPQSTASDICLDALINLVPRFEGLAKPRNTVHDAIIVECHKDDEEEVKALMREEMLAAAVRIVGDYVRFDVESTVGQNWGEL